MLVFVFVLFCWFFFNFYFPLVCFNFLISFCFLCWLFSQLHVFFLVVTTFRSLSGISRICQSLLLFLVFSYSLLLQSRFSVSCSFSEIHQKSRHYQIKKGYLSFFSLPLLSLSPSLSLHNFLFGLLAEDDGRRSQELFIYLLLHNPGRLFSLSQCWLKSLWLCLWHGQMFDGIFESLGPHGHCICILTHSVPPGNLDRNPDTQARSDLAYSLLGTSKWGGYLAEECICSATRMWPAHIPWVGDYKILWNKHS